MILRNILTLIILLIGSTIPRLSIAQEEGQLLGPTTKDSACQVLYDQYDYYNALECYLELIDLYEDRAEDDDYYASKFKLANIYYTLGYVRESAGLAAQIAEHFKKKDPILEASAKLLLSEAYYNLGEAEKSKSVVQSLSKRKWRNLPKSVQIQKLLMDARHLAYSGDTIDAMEQLELATQWCLDNAEPKNYPKIQFFIGQLEYKKGKIKDALRSFLKCSKVARETNNLFQYEEALEYIIDILAENGRYEKAYELMEERNTIRDSLFALNKQEITSRLIVKYETQNKQKTIYDLKGEQRATELKTRRSSLANYALLISFLAVLAAAYLIITFYQQKLSSSQIITTQKELINQQKITELEKNIQIESMQSMMKGQELERERVAKDLHDSLGGMLSAIKLKFEAMIYRKGNQFVEADYKGVQGLLDHACQEVRNISSNLQPGALEQLGLIEALNDLINKYEQGSDIEIHFQHYGVMENKRLDSFTSLNIYRIIQELLNNALKHAQANEIIVQLNREKGKITIMVEDDGIGFDPTQIQEGMGSENVRSRVNFLKGEMGIDSLLGEGTTILIIVPLM